MVKIKEKNSKMKKDFKRIGNAFNSITWYFTNFFNFFIARFSAGLDDGIQFVSDTDTFTTCLSLEDSEFE